MRDYLATLKTMLNECVDLKWLDHAPRIKRNKEPKCRVRWEPQEAIKCLINGLRLPWMRDTAIVAVATGMREEELLTLTVAQVNLGLRSVHLDKTKSRYRRATRWFSPVAVRHRRKWTDSLTRRN